MKKSIYTIFAIFLLLGLVAYSFKQNDNSQDEQIKQTNSPSKFLDNFVKADWLNSLPDCSWDEIRLKNDTYSYDFKEELSGETNINKSVSYTKNTDDTYVGTMKITFLKETDSYIANIPKSFASHVDSLNFSINPSKIINSDPIVEFTNIDGIVEIESTETKNVDEVKASLEEQVFETESKRCDNLSGNESVVCSLSLIAKYRHNKVLSEELSHIDMNDVAGGSAVAVLKSDLGTCDYIKDRKGRIRCYEYAYQILVDECHISDGKKYRDCVRDLSSELPSFKEQRLFCGHIDDEAMRMECQGLVDVEVCDEIDDTNKKNLCKLNIARTNNNIDTCDQIDNFDYKQVCVALIGVANDEEAYCDKIEDEYISGQCRAKIAIQKNDKKICDRIKDEDSKNLCYGHFIINKQDVSQEMCNNINELFIKEMCEMVLAIKNKDTWKCSSPDIVTPYNQPICFLGIAIKHKDESYCEKITEVGEMGVETEEAKEKLRDNCYSVIASTKPDESLCDNIINSDVKNKCKEGFSKPLVKKEETNEEKLANYPSIPDWMDCPIPEGAVLKNIDGGQQSGYYYYNKEIRKRVGIRLAWWGPNFDFPYQFKCYDENGIEHGPFKEWIQNKDALRQEGTYKNGKLDGVVKSYSDFTLFTVITYIDGQKTGPVERYCTKSGKSCNKGNIIQKGFYQNGKQHGFWKTYEFGKFKYKEEFVNGEVTRDETGMNIRYYSE